MEGPKLGLWKHLSGESQRQSRVCNSQAVSRKVLSARPPELDTCGVRGKVFERQQCSGKTWGQRVG